MKVRSGFVSNSSSSSFVICATLDVWEKILKELNEYEIKLANHFFNDRKFGGQTVKFCSKRICTDDEDLTEGIPSLDENDKELLNEEDYDRLYEKREDALNSILYNCRRFKDQIIFSEGD